jgi:hypothetical protein
MITVIICMVIWCSVGSIHKKKKKNSSRIWFTKKNSIRIWFGIDLIWKIDSQEENRFAFNSELVRFTKQSSICIRFDSPKKKKKNSIWFGFGLICMITILICMITVLICMITVLICMVICCSVGSNHKKKKTRVEFDLPKKHSIRIWFGIDLIWKIDSHLIRFSRRKSIRI